jgi:hypothetical protein
MFEDVRRIAGSLLRTATNPVNGWHKKNIMLPPFTAMDAAESPNHPPATVPEGFVPQGKTLIKDFFQQALISGQSRLSWNFP